MTVRTHEAVINEAKMDSIVAGDIYEIQSKETRAFTRGRDSKPG